MGDTTKIQWCDHTFNPWEGCTKVSPGCANCYAEARNHRFGLDNWGKDKPRRRTSAANWRKPLKWNEFPFVCQQCGRGWSNSGRCIETMEHSRCGGETHRARVFCASLADWLDDEVPIEWLADLLKLIHDTPNLDWLLLTKRPENWLSRTTAIWKSEALDSPLRKMLLTWQAGEAPPNIWIGTSIEDQKRDERILHLLRIPAKVRFLSVEPLLGDLKIFQWFGLSANPQWPEGIDWVIVGGESGRNARPCNVDWIRDIVRQCKAAGVPVFVKQLGAVVVEDEPQMTARGWEQSATVRVKLKDPKGGDMAEWPEDLRVREFPV